MYLIQITKCFKDVTSYLHLKPVIVRLVQSAAVHSASLCCAVLHFSISPINQSDKVFNEWQLEC